MSPVPFDSLFFGTRSHGPRSCPFALPCLPRPCNFRPLQNASDAKLNGMVVVAALDGPVAVLDQTNKVVSVIDVNGLIGAFTGSKHPHDAIFMPNGDIVVATWNPGFVSYWRLLPVNNKTVG